MRTAALALASLAAFLCPAPAAHAAEPLVLWHTQSQSNAALLQKIADEYNATNPPIPVALHFGGDYTELFRKVRAAIPTKTVPDLVVAYESMIAEYIELDAVVPLDDYIADPAAGLSKENLDDFFPSILENNRYPAYGGKFYSFPFTKSILMLYYNVDLLKAAGFTQPPKTWAEFKAQCLAVKEKTWKRGYALSVDASTFDAMVYSFGGELLAGKRPLFDRPASVSALRLITDLVQSGAAYQIDRGSYGDRKDFSSGQCAFIVRSSTTRPYIDSDIKDRFHWDMAVIPHDEPQRPVTVLFGANIAVMRTAPERQRAAWLFINYFNSTDVTARWATGTGYVPVRKSAAETGTVKQFFAQNPRNRRAFDAIPCARPEPGLPGWQGVRDQIELAQSRAVGGRTAPESLAAELNRKARSELGLNDTTAPGRSTGGDAGTPVIVIALLIIIIVAALVVRSIRSRPAR